VPTLLAVVTQAKQAAVIAEAARVVAMFAAETSAQEAAAPRHSATLHVKDAENRAILVEKEALERVSRAEARNAMALASAHEDAEGFARKIPFLKTSLPQSVRLGSYLRGSAENNSRSSPFCRHGAPSYVTPSSIPHGRGITCLRGCGLRPSTILKWLENLPCFGRWCLLSQSWCLGTHPVIPFMWR
jgi:hypothetical protein